MPASTPVEIAPSLSYMVVNSEPVDDWFQNSHIALYDAASRVSGMVVVTGILDGEVTRSQVLSAYESAPLLPLVNMEILARLVSATTKAV